jgi:hypothetical protein
MQLMLLERHNMAKLRMAREEQDREIEQLQRLGGD